VPLGPGIVRTGLGYSLRTYSGLIPDLGLLTIGFDRTTSNGAYFKCIVTMHRRVSLIRLRELAKYP